MVYHTGVHYTRHIPSQAVTHTRLLLLLPTVAHLSGHWKTAAASLCPHHIALLGSLVHVVMCIPPHARLTQVDRVHSTDGDRANHHGDGQERDYDT